MQSRLEVQGNVARDVLHTFFEWLSKSNPDICLARHSYGGELMACGNTEELIDQFTIDKPMVRQREELQHKPFPILQTSANIVDPKYPKYVPWALVAAHAEQAMRNHNQTVERLAERGGLGWSELLDVLLDRPWDGVAFWLPKQREAYVTSQTKAAEKCMKIISDWSKAQ